MCVPKAEYVLAKEKYLYGPREKAVWKWDTGRLSPLFCGLSFVLFPTTAMSWSSALVEGRDCLSLPSSRHLAVLLQQPWDDCGCQDL